MLLSMLPSHYNATIPTSCYSLHTTTLMFFSEKRLRQKLYFCPREIKQKMCKKNKFCLKRTTTKHIIKQKVRKNNVFPWVGIITKRVPSLGSQCSCPHPCYCAHTTIPMLLFPQCGLHATIPTIASPCYNPHATILSPCYCHMLLSPCYYPHATIPM